MGHFFFGKRFGLRPESPFFAVGSRIWACAKLVIVIVTIKYSIVTTFKEYVVINTVTTFSSCKSIISTHSCCNRADKL